MAIRFIYFDLGNVVVDFDHEIACRQIAALVDLPVEQVRQVIFAGGLQVQYESGQISSQEFCQQFCEATRTQATLADLLQAGSAIFQLKVPTVPILANLAAAGYRLGILSNTCDAHWQYVTRGCLRGIRSLFAVQVLSYQVGVMKPDPQIYQVAVDVAGTAAAEVFFTDDRPENVLAARQAGIDAVQFTSPRQLIVDLRQRGVCCNI